MKETDAIAFLRPTPLTSVNDIEALHHIQQEHPDFYHTFQQHNRHQRVHVSRDLDQLHVPEPDYPVNKSREKKSGCFGKRICCIGIIILILLLILGVTLAVLLTLNASDGEGKLSINLI